MKQIVRVTAAVICFAAITLLNGCASPLKVNSQPYSAGRILILPPHDVVQDGVPHEKGVGSGKYFQQEMQNRFSGTIFELVTTDSNAFSATTVATKEQALAEAKRMNAAYCLQVVLGEFQDAFPMSFRPDFINLDKAIMYDASNGEVVWELTTPIYSKKGNVGSYKGLMDEQSEMIAKSILAHVKNK